MFLNTFPISCVLQNRVDSRFCVNETSRSSERYSGQMQAAMKQKSLLMFGQMYCSMIECNRRATVGTLILNLIYCILHLKEKHMIYQNIGPLTAIHSYFELEDLIVSSLMISIFVRDHECARRMGFSPSFLIFRQGFFFEIRLPIFFTYLEWLWLRKLSQQLMIVDGNRGKPHRNAKHYMTFLKWWLFVVAKTLKWGGFTSMRKWFGPWLWICGRYICIF